MDENLLDALIPATDGQELAALAIREKLLPMLTSAQYRYREARERADEAEQRSNGEMTLRLISASAVESRMAGELAAITNVFRVLGLELPRAPR